jgi:cell wall-associated NlpC family hydrolase
MIGAGHIGGLKMGALVVDRLAINRWIQDRIGTPHRWDGRGPDGLDCYGLVWSFYRDCMGVTLPDWTAEEQRRAWVIRTMSAEREAHFRAIGEPVEPCVALCECRSGPHHMGLYWQGGVVHAATGQGVAWQSRIVFERAFGPVVYGELVP